MSIARRKSIFVEPKTWKTALLTVSVCLVLASIAIAGPTVETSGPGRGEFVGIVTRFLSAIPTNIRSDVLARLESSEMTTERPVFPVPAYIIGTEASLPADYESRFQDLKTKIESEDPSQLLKITNEMGALGAQLLNGLSDGQRHKITEAYHDARQHIFDLNLIRHFIVATFEDPDLIQTLDAASDPNPYPPVMAQYVVLRDPKDHALDVLHGMHGYPELAILFKDKIQRKIEVAPDDYAFFLEGLREPLPEVKAALEIAERYRIPAHDPIVSYTSRPVVDRYLELPRTHREILPLLRGEGIEMLSKDRARLVIYGLLTLGHQAPDQPLASAIREMAATADIRPKEISDFIAGLTGELRKNSVEARILWIQILQTQVRPLVRELRSISNALSQQILSIWLDQYPDKKKAFIYFGSGHRPIVDRKEFDPRYLFSTNQMQAALFEREAEYERWNALRQERRPRYH